MFRMTRVTGFDVATLLNLPKQYGEERSSDTMQASEAAAAIKGLHGIAIVKRVLQA
jgi:hypothetical protein